MPLRKGTLFGYDVYARCPQAAIDIMKPTLKVVHRNSFNVASMSFAPEHVYEAIKKEIQPQCAT